MILIPKVYKSILTEFGQISTPVYLNDREGGKGRIYDPVIGRFINPDPFVQVRGQVDGYNRYSYVRNNPLRYVDPSGYVYESGYNWGLWGIKPQQDSGHGMVGGGTTMGSQISSAGGSNGSSSYKWGKGGYSWIGGNHYIDGNGNSASWQESIEGTYQKLYGRSFFNNLNYVNRGSRKAKRLKISFSGGFKLFTGRGFSNPKMAVCSPTY